MKIIETERLILRTWKEEDIEPYFQINQDLKVIELLRGPLTMQQVKDFIPAVNQHHDALGYTLWAAEIKATGELIGFIGLNDHDFFAPSNLPFIPHIEIGWRLGSQYWGMGYATEGAMAALKFAFGNIGLSEIVSFTVPANARSIHVMEKIGMTRDISGDFKHPKLDLRHPLCQHILYRIKQL